LVDKTLLVAEAPTLARKTEGKVKLLCGIIQSLIREKKEKKIPKEHEGLAYYSLSSR
jgi:hypothetical protein